jgi:2',3'-cyclic-nucleotide 2'-phosphodiesterase
MSGKPSISVLFLGDVIGKPGRRAVVNYIASLDPKPDLIIANGENSAHGFGMTLQNMREMAEAGVSIFSGGNHTFDRKEIFDFIDQEQFVVRPANYPAGTPGHGWCVKEVNGVGIALLNLMGRVFMEPLNSPFTTADDLLPQITEQAKIVIVDFHAEATAEKVALGWYLNGRVSAVIGSHTHVQTADERVLPDGTAYITDAGCCGPADGVIGMDKVNVFRRLIQQLPARFEVAAGPAMINGVMMRFNEETGKAESIERVHYREPDYADSKSDAVEQEVLQDQRGI